MPDTLAYALLGVLFVSALSFIGVFTFSLSDRVLKSLVFVLVSMSAGALFGDAFIHLIPEALESGVRPDIISLIILSGILFFFVLEKFLQWRHSHGTYEESIESGIAHDHSKKTIGVMVLVGDGIHNVIDGVIIGTSFLVSIEVGIATTLAVVLHEIPQEIGDFGLLIHAGFTKAKALFYNFISALIALFGAAGVFVLGIENSFFLPMTLAFAAGGFVYIAGSDLVPEIQRTTELKKSIAQVFSMIIGVLVMVLLLYLD